MVYFPVVGRLDCGSSSEEHEGFWEVNGYGIMSIYKSDWKRFGGKFNSDWFLFTDFPNFSPNPSLFEFSLS